MVKIVAKMHAKETPPAECLAIAKELVEKTNALDRGCIGYEFCQDANDPLGFAMMEQWESQEALDAHMKSAHFTALVPKMNAYFDGPTDIAAYKKLY